MKYALTILILLTLFSLTNSCKIKRQLETVATYKEHHSKRHGGHGSWSMYAGNREWDYVRGFDAQAIGAKYICVYDSLNPWFNNYIDWCRPVFIAGEPVDSTIAITGNDMAFPSKHERTLYFNFTVGGKTYEAWQKIPARSNMLIIKKGDRFKIAYWALNPARAIINLNRPIK